MNRIVQTQIFSWKAFIVRDKEKDHAEDLDDDVSQSTFLNKAKEDEKISDDGNDHGEDPDDDSPPSTFSPMLRRERTSGGGCGEESIKMLP